MRTLNSTQVRAIYEKALTVYLPKDYEVHHIDLNPENNNIDNLVALPKGLHRAYHEALSNLTNSGFIFTIDLKPRGLSEKGSKAFGFAIDLLNRYNFVHADVVEFINYRDYKRGIIPNISTANYY